MNWTTPIRWRGFINRSSINLSLQVIAQLPPIPKAEIKKMPMEELIDTTQILQSVPNDVRPTESELIELADLPIGDFTNIDSENKSSKYQEGLEEYITRQGEDLVKDTIGMMLIGIGTWLANPIGPEDAASPGPLDELVGLGLIWTGRFIMWL